MVECGREKEREREQKLDGVLLCRRVFVDTNIEALSAIREIRKSVAV